MPEESTTPDLVERVRDFWVRAARSDWDGILAQYGPDAVWDMSPLGLGTYEDEATMRGLWDDWVSAYDELELDVDALDVGNGVVLAVLNQNARPVGSTGWVQAQQMLVYLWIKGMVSRVTVYPDIDQARDAAERLAESRR